MTAQAEKAVQAMRYGCDRGVGVPVVSVTGEADHGSALSAVDGR